MKTYYILNPEVAGFVIPNNHQISPSSLKTIEYVFDGWLGDDLLESTPYFICTDRLAENLKESKLKGFLLKNCLVSKSELFAELYPKRTLPQFYWLDIIGIISQDFFLNSNHSLIVSNDALEILQRVHLNFCEIDEYPLNGPSIINLA